MIVALDTEAFYSKEVSIGTLGTWHYLRHPEADLYLITVLTDTGISFVGHPKDFNWSLINRPDAEWLSHNTSYDSLVVERLQELGHAPEHINIKAWHCTADLAAYLGYPRSLKEASHHLLGVEMSKETRNQMMGQKWGDMTPEFRAEVELYALDDSKYCLQLWLQHGHKWPESERLISQMTREMCSRGIPLDVEGIERDIEKLKVDMWTLRQAIPWKDDPHRTPANAKRGEKIALLSPIALREECAKQGLVAPKSFAQDDPECEQFFEDYSERFPWIGAVRDYRKAGKHLATLETMRQRDRGDGWMSYGLKYFGAHTGRDSGDAGFSVQNIPRSDVMGVNLRAKIKAPEGYTFAIVDLSQIEPRCIHYLAKDSVTLEYIKEVGDVYEAQARAWGLFSGEGTLRDRDSKLRHTMKQLALGLSYGMGAKKFQSVAKVTREESERLTALYRSKNPKITALWENLEANLRVTATSTECDATVILPSSRGIAYRAVSTDNNGLTCVLPRLGRLMRLGLWGGVLAENATQAMARDVFMYHCTQIRKQGIPILMRIHDEVVCLVKEEEAEAKLAQIIEIMSIPPAWCSTLPLAAEGSLSKVYKK